jgi:hypothetical protein
VEAIMTRFLLFGVSGLLLFLNLLALAAEPNLLVDQTNTPFFG